MIPERTGLDWRWNVCLRAPRRSLLPICGRPLERKWLLVCRHDVGCCHLSGLCCSFWLRARMGVRGPEPSHPKRARWHGGKRWFFRPRLADCCAIPSFDRPRVPDSL
jgi:hypothetical protein